MDGKEPHCALSRTSKSHAMVPRNRANMSKYLFTAVDSTALACFYTVEYVDAMTLFHFCTMGRSVTSIHGHSSGCKEAIEFVHNDLWVSGRVIILELNGSACKSRLTLHASQMLRSPSPIPVQSNFLCHLAEVIGSHFSTNFCQLWN